MQAPSSKSKKALLLGVGGVVLLGLAGYYTLTSPTLWSMTHPKRDVADQGPADIENGRVMFVAADCATCHATPGQGDMTRLGGGRTLDTKFGLFRMPNISPDPDTGIGAWTQDDFIRAVREGVGRKGENLYPAFPYTSYQRMTANDLRDMFAYIKTLPPVANAVAAHELKFPFTMRRGIGVWRLAFLDGAPLPDMPPLPDMKKADAARPDSGAALMERGRYLVEGPGHCVECHSPRTVMGNIPGSKRFGGGPTPEGTAYFPNISPDETGIGFWAANSIKDYLRTGISPIGKRAGGDMKEVIDNTAQLSERDRLAMAVYLKTVSAVDMPGPGMPEPNRTTKVVMLPPELTVRKKVALPVSTATEIARADTVYVSHTKAFALDKANIGKTDAADGKVLGAAALRVLQRDGGKLQVRLDGWQVSGADSAFYAQQGQRIMQAVLGPAAIAQVERRNAVTDAATGQQWSENSLTVWIDDEGLNAKLPELWQSGAQLFNSACAVCHALPDSHHYLANQWIGNLNAMKRFTALSDDEYRLLLAYLQNHSKDVGASQSSH